jgi:hypothetical protein
MGQVYRARDPRLHREVALKVLHPSVTITAEHLDRFNREARATGALNHPNIRVVFDAGVDGGIPYVISELLEGESLRERLDKGPLPYRKALEYGIQIAQALGAAHAAGIWHRDVKPANIFITDDGRIKLLDFGLAKLTEGDPPAGSHDSTADASRPGVIRGTAAYMSPEQARGQRVDHRTDLFSLGAVLYEMFTGARTFQRASTVETLHAVLREEPADPLEINPLLPPVAAVTVRRCLEKNVEERFQSARDLAFQLQQLQESTAKGRAAVAGSRPRIARRAALAVLALAAAAGAIALVKRAMDAPPPRFERLTFRRGRISGARFASGGQSVVYSATDDRNEMEVWRLDGSAGHAQGGAGPVRGAPVRGRRARGGTAHDRVHRRGRAAPRADGGRGRRGLGRVRRAAGRGVLGGNGRRGTPRVSDRPPLVHRPLHPLPARLPGRPAHRLPGRS